MAEIVKPPTPIDWSRPRPSVFLAGSIEQDRAQPWQARVEEALQDRDVLILNPRRLSWDASWRQDIDEPGFRQQVEWELEGLERASTVIVYFDPATRSPITLLELGALARSGRLLVACPEGFWRRGNVQIVCHRYGVPLCDSLEALITLLLATLDHARQPGVTVVGLDHVQLAMPAGGEDAARAFYSGVLGLPELPKPPLLAVRGGCWFQGAGFQLHLGVEDPFRPARKAHPALRVAGIERGRAALEALGVPCTLDTSIPGLRRLHTEDPFGNRLELMEHADLSAAGAP